MNSDQFSPSRSAEFMAFVQSLWKPTLALIGLFIASIIYQYANSSNFGLGCSLGLVLAMVMISWARILQFLHALININGNEHKELTNYSPMSRLLGFVVLGAFSCLIGFSISYFNELNSTIGSWIVDIGVGFGLAGCANQFSAWNPNFNRFASPLVHRDEKLVLGVLLPVGFFIWVWSLGGAFSTMFPASPDQTCLIGLIHSIVLLCLCWLAFHRQAIELFLEPFVWILYSIRAVGPCAYQLPPAGPLLIVANHSSWFDPVFLAKVLPRPITPMMTSRFYDIWFLRPLLKYVFKVIVVPDQRVRREAPELQLAIAALDRGEVVVIFPEGALRRKEEVPLKRFGQGIHMILRERPETPVISCWIEGAWGSFFSYFNGPPTKNKKMDFRRKIQVAVSEPETVPEEVLADQLPTRIYMMNRVLAARELLGLPPLPKVELPAKEEDEAM